MTCAAGEILGVLGPNGAGKSTLLSILASLLSPSSGEVRYGSTTAAEAGAALRGRLGLLAHDLYLYPELTARENLTFFARLYGVPDVGRRVADALDRATLTSRGDDVVSSFSRGMRQRLALERTLLHAPRLILLDEPFTGLDEASVGALVARLRGLRDVGTIVIVTTHDLEVAEHLIDRCVFIREGRLRASVTAGGSLRDRYRAIIHEHPADAGAVAPRTG
jgi:ABC-type multidrug transport system ATPase subunit